MAERQIHRIHRMIAIHSGGRVLAVTEKNFNRLVHLTLVGLDNFERASYLLSFSQAGAASAAHLQLLPRWDARVVEALQIRMSELGDLLSFKFQDADAQYYLPDLLEAFRGNHIGEFSWTRDEQLGSNSHVYTVATYDRPSMFDRLTRRERDPRARAVFNQSDVRAITGTALRFLVECNGFSLGFSPDGSVLKTQAVR